MQIPHTMVLLLTSTMQYASGMLWTIHATIHNTTPNLKQYRKHPTEV